MGESRIKAAALMRSGFKVIEGKREAPTFQATIAEQIVVKRFLDFAEKALAFELEGVKREKQTLAQYAESQAIANVISAYLKNLRQGVDAMTLAAPDQSA